MGKEKQDDLVVLMPRSYSSSSSELHHLIAFRVVAHLIKSDETNSWFDRNFSKFCE